jgi:hypothetical protein
MMCCGEWIFVCTRVQSISDRGMGPTLTTNRKP